MDDELNFRGLFGELRRRPLWIASAVIVGAVLAYAASYLVEPEYRAEVVMIPAEENNLLGSLGSLNPAIGGLVAAAGLGNQPRTKEREGLAILESRSFALNFLRQDGALQALFPEIWDPVTKRWRTKTAEPPTQNDVFQRFDKRVRTVKRDTETGLVILSIRLRDRRVAADWANRLASQLNASMRQRAIDEAKKSLSFLDRELTHTEAVEIRQAIYGLVESQTKEIMLANVREEYAFRIIDPALAPDPRAFVYPQRLLFALVGAALGFFVAAVIAIALARPRVTTRMMEHA